MTFAKDKVLTISPNLSLATTGKTTVEFWMYWDGSSSTAMPFTFSTKLSMYLSGGYFGFNTFSSDIIGVSSAGLANKWVHVAAVFPNNSVLTPSNCELYIDGVKQNIQQVKGTTTVLRPVSKSATIGGYIQDGVQKYAFGGKLANFRIWDKARTGQEIQSNFYKEMKGNESNLVGQWLMPSEPLSSLPFDKTKVISLANLDTNKVSSGGNTVDFWMYWDGVENSIPFTWSSGYKLVFRNGYFGFSTNSSDLIGISSTDLKNKWIHITAVFPNSTIKADTCQLYVNGVKQTLTQAAGTTASSVATSTTAYIGGYQSDAGQTSSLFGGKLSDLRIWNSSRTQADIQNDMYRTLSLSESNLAGEWLLASEPSKATTLVTNAYSYSDVDVNTTSGGYNTVEFWMYWAGGSGDMPFAWSTQYGLYFSSGNFGFNTFKSDIIGIDATSYKKTWVHVAAVFPNGVPTTTTAELYINGVKQNIQQLAGTTTSSVLASKTLSVGAFEVGSKRKYEFSGKLANVQVWNKKLDQNQIISDMYRVYPDNTSSRTSLKMVTDDFYIIES
ncbi:LamG domain-containing protein (plasmid) [Paenibacillus cellulosilyticus]|nr:LamG domain-containing protein [Paenibacillus cellulosilyticus]